MSNPSAKLLWYILRQMIPNVGTVLVIALMLFAYRAQAFSQGSASNSPAVGAAAGVVSYQGTLSDADGNPVDGNVDIEFKLFDAPTNGTLKWTETYSGANAVSVKNGVFHVLLGSINAFQPSDWSTYPLYLEIKVGSDAPMTPREMISAVPSAVSVPPGSITSIQLAPEVNQIHLLDEPVMVLKQIAQVGTATTGFAPLDLSVIIPSNAKSVLLDIGVAPYAGNAARLSIRKPGSTAEPTPKVETLGGWDFEQGWVNVVNGQVDYEAYVYNGTNLYFYVQVVGYMD